MLIGPRSRASTPAYNDHMAELGARCDQTSGQIFVRCGNRESLAPALPLSNELLAEPIVRLTMARDQVHELGIRRGFSRASRPCNPL